MPASSSTSENALVTLTETNGLVKVFKDTPLAKLNYFDGRYLRAEDLTREQRYHELRSELVALGQGSGPVYGLGIDPTGQIGGELTVTPGLGFNDRGEMVHLSGAVSFSLPALVAATEKLTAATAPGNAAPAGFGDCQMAEVPSTEATSATQPVYLITIAPAAAFCGRQDVYGQLCEAACVQGSAANLILSGSLLRARPVNLTLPPVSGSGDLHLRSRVATAWFRREAARSGKLLGPGGLRLHDWCGTADAGDGREIDLALALLRNGSWIVVDQWAVRRERMTPLPLGAWQGRIGMRRHEVFLAEVLQFQCQLSDILAGAGVPMPPASLPPSVCADLIARLDLTDEQRAALAKIVAEMPPIVAAPGPAIAPPGWLFSAGVVELPPAGFLPVDPASATGLRQQAVNLLGANVDFRLIAAPADVIPHAFEEARDMRRIPLITELLQIGETRPQLEVYVPDATVKPGFGLDDFRSTHAGLHATAYLQVAASIGMTFEAITSTGILRNVQDSDQPVLPSWIRIGLEQGGAALSLLSCPAAKSQPELSRGVRRDMTFGNSLLNEAVVDESSSTLASGPSEVKEGGEALLAAGDRLFDGIGLRVRASGDGFGGGDPLVFDWGLGLNIRKEAARLVSDGQILIETERGDDLELEGDLNGVLAQYSFGQATVTSEFDADFDGKTFKDSVTRTVSLRTWAFEDPILKAPSLYILSDVWDESEIGDAFKAELPTALGLAFLLTAGGLVPQVLRLLPHSDISDVDFILETRKRMMVPNGLTDGFDRSVAGAAFDRLTKLVSDVDAKLGDTIREHFRVSKSGDTTVAATRDWVMFRRSRAVTEIVEPAPAPAITVATPAEPPPKPAEPVPVAERKWHISGQRMARSIYEAIAGQVVSGNLEEVANLIVEAGLLEKVRANEDDVLFTGLTLSAATSASVARIEVDAPWIPAGAAGHFPWFVAFASGALIADAKGDAQLRTVVTSVQRRLKEAGNDTGEVVVFETPEDQLGGDDAVLMLIPMLIS